MAGDEIEVPLTLLDGIPARVGGPQAFVLYQPDVGRVEVGNPLPGREVVSHASGDVRFTLVHQLDGSRTEGGGGAWDDDELDVLSSEPNSDGHSESGAWVVVGRIPIEHDRVAVDHGGQRFVQTPIHRTAVLPLAYSGGPRFRISGFDQDGIETLLFES